MSTEEMEMSNLQANLPPYPEMILSAIEALNEPNGSNKSAIGRQIEDIYGELTPAHHTLITNHLNKMKSSGELQFVKNNYLKPDPNPPPRRGRGRPPKAKTPLPAGFVLPPPRPRGRPPKSAVSPSSVPAAPKPAAPTSTAVLSGKKRGRPAKTAVVGEVAPPAPPAGGTPRGRGRPPKVKPAVAAPVGA